MLLIANLRFRKISIMVIKVERFSQNKTYLTLIFPLMSSFTGAKAVDPRMSENRKTKDNIKPHEQLSFPITLYY